MPHSERCEDGARNNNKNETEVGIQSRSVRFLATLLALLLATWIYQKVEPPKQSLEIRDPSEQSQGEIRPPSSSADINGSTTAKLNSDAHQTNTSNNGWTHWLAPIDPFSTAIIALFTVLTYLTLRSQLEANKIEKRAWLVSDIGSIEETKIKGTFQVIVQLRNNGKSPAWVTAAGSKGLWATDTNPLPKDPKSCYDLMGPFTKKGQLLPPTAWLPQGFSLPNAELTRAVRKEVILYVFGFIEYRDIYGDHHRTRYCYQAKPTLDQTSPNPLDFYVGGPDEYSDAT